MSKGWPSGSTPAWRSTRRYVLIRDRYRCRAHDDGWCARAGRKTKHTCRGAAPLTGGRLHSGQAHHTLGRSVTGDDPAHIVAACRPCNLHIGDPTTAADKPDPPLKTVTRWR